MLNLKLKKNSSFDGFKINCFKIEFNRSFLNIPKKNSRVSFRPKKNKNSLQIGFLFQNLKKKPKFIHFYKQYDLVSKLPRHLGKMFIYLFIYWCYISSMRGLKEDTTTHTHVGMQRKKPELVADLKKEIWNLIVVVSKKFVLWFLIQQKLTFFWCDFRVFVLEWENEWNYNKVTTHNLHDRLLQLHEVPCLPLYESVLDYIPHHHLLLPQAYLPLALAFYFVYTKWGAQINGHGHNWRASCVT